MRYNVVYSLIERRNKSIHSKYGKPDCGHLLESSSMNARESFFRECASINNADRYYETCISELADDKDGRLTRIFVESILPYVDNLDHVSTTIEKYKSELKPKTYGILEIAVNQNKIADRVLDNHEKINEKCDIAHSAYLKRNQDISRLSRAICEAVDTFDLKEHAKLNVCLEECSYLLEKNKIKYKPEEMVKSIVEYFLMRNGKVDSNILPKFYKVLEENSFIADNDLRGVYYLYEGFDDSGLPVVSKMLNGFTKAENKDIKGDFNSICQSMPNPDTVPQNEFCGGGIKNLLSYIRTNMLYDAYDIEEIVEALDTIPANIESRMSNDPMSYNREELECIINTYKNEVVNLESMISEYQDQKMCSRYIALRDCYMNTINRLTIFQNNLYTQYNIECMTHASKVKTECLYLNEFKIFKFNNILKLAAQAERAIHRKNKAASKKVKNALNIADKVNNALEKEKATTKMEKSVRKAKRRAKKGKGLFEADLSEYITNEDTIDIMIESFDIIDESALPEIHEYMSEVCKDINDNVLTRETACCYYVLAGDTVEIHMEDATDLVLNDAEDYDVHHEWLNAQDKDNVLDIIETAALFDEMDLNRAANMANEIKEATDWIDRERFDLIIEAAKCSCLITEEDLAEFVSLYSRKHDLDLNESTYLNQYIPETTLEIQVEAYDLLCSILETDEQKEKDKKDNIVKKAMDADKTVGDKIRAKANDTSKSISGDKSSGDSDKKAGSGVSLNNIKLNIKGMQAKAKDMGNKVQNKTHNMEMASSRFMTGVKDALTNDRREGIITGSIVPSFKKCIMWGIGLAGLGIAASPVLSIIVAMGAFAISKNLNKKERLLLMDEIETELEVVDKEIEIAESRHQMKKYRELLKYKKELQRQLQRLKYNTRIGKDLMPGVTTGLPEKN